MTGDNADSYEESIQKLKTIPDWKDADQQITVCQNKIKEIREKERQQRLEQERKAEQRRKEQVQQAEVHRQEVEKRKKKTKKIAMIVTPIVCVCIALAIVLQVVIIPSQKLKKANGLILAGDYDAAYSLLMKIERDDVITENKYDRSVALIESGDYDAAYSLLEEIERDDVITESKHDRSLALIESGDYDAAYALLEEIKRNDVIVESKYNRAIALIEAGDYIAAYELLDCLNYQDSEERMQEIKPEYHKYLLQNSQVGDTVFFGAYEQDNDDSNGKEDIEWQVLDKKNGKIMVISKYALDWKPYSAKWENITWENSTLRKWLNSEFINNAFTAEEQKLIPTMTVSADKNPVYKVNPGNTTHEQIFLLSVLEINQYFTSDNARICKPTPYAAAGSANVSESDSCGWWLRSPGTNQKFVAYIHGDGGVDAYGGGCNGSTAVRPAMWIDLGA